MRQYNIGAIPVGENDRLIGMVTDRDITVRGVANGKDLSKLTARDVMTKGVIWCRDTDKAKNTARIMESKRVRRLPVIDANKRMVGIDPTRILSPLPAPAHISNMGGRCGNSALLC